FVKCIESLETMGSLYTDENLDMFKDVFTYKIVSESIPYLTPRLTYAAYEEMGIDPTQFYTEEAAAESAYAAITSPQTFSNALASIFVQETKDVGYIEALTSLTEEVIGSYKEMINECEWASASAKEGILKKLDNMKMNMLVPEGGYADYSGVSLKTAEEGGSLLENYLIMKKYNRDAQNLQIGKPATSDTAWDLMGASVTNAFYDQETNSVNVVPGFVNAMTCDPSSMENLYAGVGTVIGHEISHGFDVMGSQYDYNGKPNAIFTGEDKAAYLERISKINDYLSSIWITEDIQCDGELISSEATADLCGMASVLRVAKNKENFNYEQFFERNANIYAQTMPYEAVVMTNASDGHPQNYMRINVMDQMFEEFYKTYSVAEGDTMYLAPEERVSVWW
ncbi:MAG: hypothetical protein HUJ73_00400, partial [Eubacterium sp.]|nr:hypothetical protein [Eubacterium sp.]